MKKKVLILGNGAREHAIAKKFKQSKHVTNIYVIPGNDGIRSEFPCDVVDFSFEKINEFIVRNSIDLVFVGNEQYLADGITDFLIEKKIAVIGPTKVATQIESSKVFAKNLMKKYNIPTAFYQTFTDPENAIASLRGKTNISEFDKGGTLPSFVIKADGLAAGKGVIIVNNLNEAEVCICEMLSGKRFGNAGNQIIIEEFLHGEEASIFAFCDGDSFVSTVFAQDHKRAFDNDQGLNTGGMGAYAPVDKFSHLQQLVDNQIFAPILIAMKNEGCPFTGVLFAGLMIQNDQVKVIEFNCRFGDPEAQVILPLLENDIFEISQAILNKTIKDIKLKFKDQYAVNIVLASIGYPEFFEKGHQIEIDPILYDNENLQLLFAGISYDSISKCFKNSGGRVLGLTGIENSFQKARKNVYSKLFLIQSDILRYRNDIGKRNEA